MEIVLVLLWALGLILGAGAGYGTAAIVARNNRKSETPTRSGQ